MTHLLRLHGSAQTSQTAVGAMQICQAHARTAANMPETGTCPNDLKSQNSPAGAKGWCPDVEDGLGDLT